MEIEESRLELLEERIASLEKENRLLFRWGWMGVLGLNFFVACRVIYIFGVSMNHFRKMFTELLAGEPLPYVSWDADSVGLTGDLIYGMGVPNGDIIRRLLPLLRHIGLDIIVQMPLAKDAAIIPYRDEDGGLMQSMAAAAIEDPDAKMKFQLELLLFIKIKLLHVHITR